jgi:hypothetical protein
MSKVELIYAITEHLKIKSNALKNPFDEGGRNPPTNRGMTNLKKASLEQLTKIILDNDINLMDYIELRKQEMKQDREKKKIEKVKRDKETEEHNKKWKEEQESREHRRKNYIYKLSLMTEEERQNVKKNWIEREQIKDRLYMEKNKDQIEKAKQNIKTTTEIMRGELGGDITENGLYINGVNVVITDMYDFNPRTAEKLESDYNDYYE